MIAIFRFGLLFTIAIAVGLLQASTLRVVLNEPEAPDYQSLVLVFAIVPSIVAGALLFFCSKEWPKKVWAFGGAAALFAAAAKFGYQPASSIERLVQASGMVGSQAEMLRASLASTSLLAMICGVLALYFALAGLCVFILKERMDQPKEAGDPSTLESRLAGRSPLQESTSAPAIPRAQSDGTSGNGGNEVKPRQESGTSGRRSVRLNGWERIGIVLVSVWIVIAAVLAYRGLSGIPPFGQVIEAGQKNIIVPTACAAIREERPGAPQGPREMVPWHEIGTECPEGTKAIASRSQLVYVQEQKRFFGFQWFAFLILPPIFGWLSVIGLARLYAWVAEGFRDKPRGDSH